VNHFHGAGGGHGHFTGAAKEFAARDRQDWPQSFPPSQQGVAHGLVNFFGVGEGQGAIKGDFDLGLAFQQVGFELEGGGFLGRGHCQKLRFLLPHSTGFRLLCRFFGRGIGLELTLSPNDVRGFAVIESKTKLTKAEFWKLADGSTDRTYELIDGVAIPKMSPKYFHSRVTLRLGRLLEDRLADRGRIGVEWAFDLNAESTPVPDLIYVSFDRLDCDWNENVACPVVPELAVEIISPGQSFGQLATKAQQYLGAGVMQVWIIDPGVQSLTVLYADRTIATFGGTMAIPDELFPDQGFTVDLLFS
jgi:Uma2 family endonuclease